MRLIPRVPFRLTLPRVVLGLYAAVAATLYFLLPPRPLATIQLPDRAGFACSSPDGNVLAFTGTSADGRYRGQIPVTDADRSTLPMIYSPDGFTYFWNRRANTVQSIGTGIREPGRAIATTEDAVWLESLAYENRWADRHLCFELCDIATRKTISKVNLPPADRLIQSLPDDRLLILEENEKAPWRISVFNLRDQSRRVVLNLPADERANRLGTCVSPNGKLLAVGSRNKAQVRIFELESGAEKVTLNLPATTTEPRIESQMQPALQFTRDGRSLCVVTSADRAPAGLAKSRAEVWSTVTGELIAEQTIRRLSWPSVGSHNDRILLHNDDFENGRAEVIDASTGDPLIVALVRGAPSDF